MTSPPDPIIETKGLTRVFGRLTAVDSLDLTIERGEIFGLVGPDGAGKTTTLRLLAGLLSISAGSAIVLDYDLRKDSEGVKSMIGYMAQRFSLYGDLTVSENLSFFADLYNVPAPIRRDRARRLLEFARLSDISDRQARHLSGGMQKKLALACTLIHEPRLLLLDEPTTGVDPVSRRDFWDILADLHFGGSTIIVSTPYMDEAERCHQVGLMHTGKLITCGRPEDIVKQVPGDLIELLPDKWVEAQTILKQLPGVIEVQTYGQVVRVFLDNADQRLPFIIKNLEERAIHYSGLRQTRVSMEEAFISLIHQQDL
jgi:ABC-2 type transport system ATP-binding protein